MIGVISPTDRCRRSAGRRDDRGPVSTTVEPGQSSTRQLLWAVRHYAWLLLLCVVGLGLAAPIVVSEQPVIYEARALVVAQQLELSSQSLPRFGEAVFTSGAVIRRVAADPGVAAPAESLVPDRLEVVTGLDSPVFEVIGKDIDPETAALLANLAATVFVEELNRAGPGIGTFALQDAAQAPDEPRSPLSLPVSVVAGVLAGTLLGGGLVTLLVVLRRPVVGPGDDDPRLVIPVISLVEIPRHLPGQYPGPRGVPGISAVARWVLDSTPGALLVASPKRASSRQRQRICVMIAATLDQLRPLTLRVPSPMRDAVLSLRATAVWPRKPTANSEPKPPLLVLDGAEPLDVVEFYDQKPFTLLVVPQGIARNALRDAAAEFLDRGLGGVVLYRSVGVPRRVLASSPLHRARRPDDAPVGAKVSTRVAAQPSSVGSFARMFRVRNSKASTE